MGWRDELVGAVGKIAIDEFMSPETSDLLFGYLYSLGADFDDIGPLPIQAQRALRIFQNIVGRLLSGHEGSINECNHPLTLVQLSSDIPINLDN